ncbi:MAG: hypothetical protein M4579_005812 [Chaenotheca gracillima]|nr:MAG: hypothetical protein M4579_005812 [Chaenotheca gracillima]
MEVIPIRQSVLRCFYEPLLLLEALGPVRGKRTKAPVHGDDIGVSPRKTQRSFLDGIAYMCAYQKSPDHVTAVALEKTPQHIKVWLAANRQVEQGVVQFLEVVLAQVQHIAVHDTGAERQSAFDNAIYQTTSDVIAFNAPRIGVYYQDVSKLLNPCLDIMIVELKKREVHSDKNTLALVRLTTWLGENFFTRSTPGGEDLDRLVRKCHSLRRSLSFEPLKDFTGQGQTRRDDFQQLYDLLLKLGKHVTVTRHVLEAAVQLSQDFAYGFEITPILSSQYRKIPLRNQDGTIEKIIGRMSSVKEFQEQFLSKLESIWNVDEISMRLQEKRARKTRVHAELLLVDYLDQNNCRFLDGDKYIGCSKPACYLCHAYIENHPGRYVVPPSHQKLYVGWRLPDVYATAPRSQEQILRKLTIKVRDDLTKEINSRSLPLPFHADSTAGVTSVFEPRMIATAESFKGMSLRGAVTAGQYLAL